MGKEGARLACVLFVYTLSFVQGKCPRSIFTEEMKEHDLYLASSSIALQDKGVIYFAVCGTLADTIQSRCSNESAVCLEGARAINYGTWSNARFSGTEQGVQFEYGPGDTCSGEGKRYKTTLQLECDPHIELQPIHVQFTTECDISITANSSIACPKLVLPMFYDGGLPTIQWTILSILCIAILACLCLCFSGLRKQSAKRREEQEATSQMSLQVLSSECLESPIGEEVFALIPQGINRLLYQGSSRKWQ